MEWSDPHREMHFVSQKLRRQEDLEDQVVEDVQGSWHQEQSCQVHQVSAVSARGEVRRREKTCSIRIKVCVQEEDESSLSRRGELYEALKSTEDFLRQVRKHLN